MDKHQVIETKTLYNGLIFDVVQNTLRLPNGKDVKRDVLHHHGAAAVVPVMDDGRIILVRQYRDATGNETLEIPAGKLEGAGEDPLACAIRELEEETGYTAASIQWLMRFYPAIGYSTEVINIYLAEGLTAGQQRLDEDEFVITEAYTPDEILQLIENGEIVDAKTIAAVLYSQAKKTR